MNIELKGIPTCYITSYEEGVNFYVHFLGFTLDWEHRMAPGEPIYMQVSLYGLVLHLSDNQRFTSKATVFVETKGLDSYRDALVSKNPDRQVAEVLATPWGTRQLEIEDGYGNLLRFNEQ